MDRKTIEQVCENLDYDWTKFTLRDFVHHIQLKRKRPIYTIAMPNLDIPLCLRLGGKDFIFYSASQTLSKQKHDILHELAHIILGHIDCQKYSSEQIQELIINLDLRLRAYQNNSAAKIEMLEDEKHAEYLAYLIQSKITENNRLITLMRVDITDDYQIPPFTSSYLKK